jgi:small multidrug resistance pump
MSWVFLSLAILLEVAAACALQVASRPGNRRWYVGVALGYIAAFGMLALALNDGMGIGIAYGIWAAAGTALTAIAGRVLFKERFTWAKALGVTLIVGGVLLIELGSGAH